MQGVFQREGGSSSGYTSNDKNEYDQLWEISRDANGRLTPLENATREGVTYHRASSVPYENTRFVRSDYAPPLYNVSEGREPLNLSLRNLQVPTHSRCETV